MTRKSEILKALHRFARSRSGMDWRDYGDARSYRAEQRSITRDLHDAEALIAAVSWRSIESDELLAAAQRAFSGRLTLTENTDGTFGVDYCEGQYYPTEYRKAVCAVLAYALWRYFRETLPATEGKETYQQGVVNMGDAIRKEARREFGRGIAGRWFN